MDDAAAVRGVEGIGDLRRGVDERVPGERPIRNPPVERLPFQQLHRDEGRAVGLFDRVDRADVGMVERAGGAGLALKPLERRAIARELRGQELQRDAAAQPGVVRLVDDAHAAAADRTHDPVVEDGRPRRQRHE